jgi:hypothetical protein
VRFRQLKVTLVGVALALALPPAASAQVLDPTLEQYAPSTQEVHKQVKGSGDGGQVQGSGDGGQVQGSGDGGQVQGSGDGGQVEQGDGAVAPVGSQGGGQGGGDGGASAGGRGGAPGGGQTPASAQGSALNDRVVSTVPLTRFDLIAMVLAVGAITGTAVVLRRLSDGQERRVVEKH